MDTNDIEVLRSRRARRISLGVRRDGSVRLTIPWWCPKSEGLRFAAERTEWILRAQERQQQRRSDQKVHSKEDIETLRRRAKERLPQILQRVSEQTGLKYNKVTVRCTHSRWGSCSSENNISLSIFLAELPDHLVEYIAVHELCHTVHRNHSAAFHALVDSYLDGREKELQKELRRYSPL